MTTPQGTVTHPVAHPVARPVVRLSSAAAVAAVAALAIGVLGLQVFQAAHRPLSWAAASVVVAVLLDPIVEALSPHLRRSIAVLVCFLVAGGAVLGATYLVFDDLDRAMDRLQEAAPAAAERIESRDDRVGEVARDAALVQRVNDATEALGRRVGAGGGEVLRSTALTAPAYLVGAVFTVFLLSYGPSIADAGFRQLPSSRRDRARTVASKAAHRARTAALLTLADAVFVTMVVAAIAYLLDLPAPAAVGVTAGIAAVLPHLGIVLGSLPLLLLTLGLRSGTAAALVIVGVLLLQTFDSLVVRRRIDAAVRIGLLAPVVVVLIANDVYGIGAAVYGMAYLAFGLAVLDQLAADDSPSDGDTPGALAAEASP